MEKPALGIPWSAQPRWSSTAARGGCAVLVSNHEKLIPRCLASRRELQCVTPSLAGGGASVADTISLWSRSRGRPERGRSTSPAIPDCSYRARHPITVGRDTPVHLAISVFDTPSAANNTIRARCAAPAITVEDWVNDTNVSRSPSRNANGAIRMHDYPIPLPSNYFRHAALGTRSIAVRRCGTFPGLAGPYLRAAVRPEWPVLVDAMTQVL